MYRALVLVPLDWHEVEAYNISIVSHLTIDEIYLTKSHCYCLHLMVSKILFENRQTNEGFEWIVMKKSLFLHQSMDNFYRIKNDDLINIGKKVLIGYLSKLQIAIIAQNPKCVCHWSEIKWTKQLTLWFLPASHRAKFMTEY